MKRAMPYSTPEGYFSELKKRLERVPQAVSAREEQALGAASKRQGAFRPAVLSPYLALAAVFAAAFVIGGIVLNNSAKPAQGKEQIVEYLLDSNLTLAQLEEIVYYYNE